MRVQSATHGKPLRQCPECKNRRTRMTRCTSCEARLRAKLARRKVPNTPANLGADAFLNAIPVPPGLTAERYGEPRGWRAEDGQDPALRLTGDGVTIRVVIHDPDGEWLPGSGHTEFTSARGSFSFDRLGVEDSFYVAADDTPAKVGETLVVQLAKVAASRARHERSESVPGLGWMVTPESRAEITAKLKAGKSHTFTPSGFGMGKRISTKPVYRHGNEVAPAETAAFFGVDRLYVETFDHD